MAAAGLRIVENSFGLTGVPGGLWQNFQNCITCCSWKDLPVFSVCAEAFQMYIFV